MHIFLKHEMDASQHSSVLVQTKIRRHDLDWMRVILFGLLIPYHVAVGLVWNIYGEGLIVTKTYQTEDGLNIYIHLFLQWMHQWRLPALFMISGMGTAFAVSRRTRGMYLSERTKRLLIPLFFTGILVNTPFLYLSSRTVPIVWETLAIELLVTSIIVGLINIFTFGQAGLHLWFLKNLYIYSIVLAVFLPSLLPRTHEETLRRIAEQEASFLQRTVQKSLSLPRGLGLMFVLPLSLLIPEFLFKPYAPGYTGNGYEFFWYWVYFLLGFFLIRNRNLFFSQLEKSRWSVTAGAFFLTAIFCIAYLNSEMFRQVYIHGGWVAYEGMYSIPSALSIILHTYHSWFWSLTIFAWAAALFNKSSNSLSYLNNSVYPLYIFHMTFIAIGLYFFVDSKIPIMVVFFLITIFTTIMCFAGYEAVKRAELTRMLFGLKPLNPKPKVMPPMYRPLISAVQNTNIQQTNLNQNICLNCQSSVSPGTRFCNNCGTEVSNTKN